MMDEIHMDFLNLKAILLCLVLCNRIGPCISSPFASWKVLKFISKQHLENTPEGCSLPVILCLPAYSNNGLPRDQLSTELVFLSVKTCTGTQIVSSQIVRPSREQLLTNFSSP